ncbi:MAG: zinc finger-like domain-containing protein [Pseudomonadota bacterium]
MPQDMDAKPLILEADMAITDPKSATKTPAQAPAAAQTTPKSDGDAAKDSAPKGAEQAPAEVELKTSGAESPEIETSENKTPETKAAETKAPDRKAAAMKAILLGTPLRRPPRTGAPRFSATAPSPKSEPRAAATPPAPARTSDAASPSTDLVPVLPGRGVSLEPLQPGAPAKPVAAAQLAPILEGAAGGAPVTLETLSEETLTLRITASIWARPEIVSERRAGVEPDGPVVENAAAAVAALSPLADAELARGRGLQALHARLSVDPWEALTGLQGDEAGQPLTERRSVIVECSDCDSAGGFACAECSGTGRRICAACDGSGQVDQECPTCRGAQKPVAREGLALDPRRALYLLLGQSPSGVSAGGGRAAIRRDDVDARRRGCADCGGVGAKRTECASCAGVGERRCQSCRGSGRVLCSSCAGEGSFTDLYSGQARLERSLHLAFSRTDKAAEPVSSEAADAVRASWDELVAARAFTPRLVSFQSSGFAAQAVFEAPLSLSRLRAVVGRRPGRSLSGARRRDRRVTVEVWATGDPPTLLDPPKALDLLHRRAIDDARVSSREGRRQVADALSRLAGGRAALRAAARRERDLPDGAFGALATDAENARLMDLARAAHGAVGWRQERQVWTGAALIAAPLGAAAALALAGSNAAAPSAEAPAFEDPLLQFFNEAAVAAQGALAAFWEGFAPIAPFLLLWLLSGMAAAWAYRRATRRALGFTRARSAWRFFLGGATPLAATLIAAVLYAGGFFAASVAHDVATGDEAIFAAIAPVPATSTSTSTSTSTGEIVSEPAAATPEPGPPAIALRPRNDQWLADGGVAAVMAEGGRVVLWASCSGQRSRFHLTGLDQGAGARTPTTLRWGTNRTGLKVRGAGMARAPDGVEAPSWRASAAAIRALRRDRRVVVRWSDRGRSGGHVFTLEGAAAALPNC